jgi:Putative metal-binding motif
MAGLALAALLLLAPPARAVPLDDYQEPFTVGLNGPQLSIPTTAATEQPGEPLVAGSPNGCEDPFGNQMRATVWLRFFGDGGPVTISTAGSDFNTLLASYDVRFGEMPTFSRIDQCSDNLGPYPHSGLVVRTRRDVDYLLQIGGCAGPVCGPFPSAGNLRVTLFSAPPNDTRAAAETVQSGVPLNRTNRGATIDVPGEVLTCGGTSYAKTIWFRWVAPAAGTATFSAGGEPNTVLGVYAAGAGQPLECNDDQSAQERASRVVRYVGPGTYDVQVGGAYAAGENSQSASDGSVAFQVDFAPDTDLDDDGYPVPADCNDANRAVNPGARDVPRNGVDEDCSGKDAPYPRVNARIFGFFTSFASGATQVERLYAKNLPARSRVTLSCRGGGCPAKRESRRVKRKRSRLSLDRALRGRRLPPGARLEVRITRKRWVGVTTTWTMRALKAPKRVDRCLRPGGKRPRRCARV